VPDTDISGILRRHAMSFQQSAILFKAREDIVDVESDFRIQ
jgi:hypothetical protein